jgi:hypothetical protein
LFIKAIIISENKTVITGKIINLRESIIKNKIPRLPLMYVVCSYLRMPLRNNRRSKAIGSGSGSMVRTS